MTASPVRLAALAGVVLAAAVAPLSLGEYRVFVLCLIGVYAIGALGLTVLVGHGGMISLGHAGFAAVGAYTAALLMIRSDVSFWLALPISGVAGGAVGLLLGWPLLRLAGPYLAVATFGFSVIVPEVVSKWPAFEVGDPKLFGGALGLSSPDPAIGGFVFDSSLRFWYVVLATLVVGFAVATLLLRSRWGSALRAYRESPIAAEAFGINTRRVRILAFGVAGTYAGLAGGLMAHLLSVLGPGTFSLTMSLTFLTAVVVGGTASPVGAIVGASAVVLLQEWLTGRTSNLQLWYGVVLLVTVILTRNGLTGAASTAWRLLAARFSRVPRHVVPDSGGAGA